jgi:trafficking protein particle complex subunit 4
LFLLTSIATFKWRFEIVVAHHRRAHATLWSRRNAKWPFFTIIIFFPVSIMIGTHTMVVHLLWIVNQSGQLIHRQVFTSNEYLGELGIKPDLHINISSVVFSMYSISQQITPNNNPMQSTGMTLIEATEHNVHVYETPTLVKFIAVTDPQTSNCDALLTEVHLAYVDIVMKNPFHVVDDGGIGQPIRIAAFQEALRHIAERYNEPPPPPRR